jgi:threonyl-tRNA synthetase
MILLLIHSSEFSFSIKQKAIEDAEEPKNSSLSLNNVLVVFTTVEREDNEDLINTAVNEILDVFHKVKADSIVIYPYAHLSSDLAEPKIAKSILEVLERKLSEKVKVFRAPFGWYKQFRIECLGHPLSELSKRIRTGIINYEEADEFSYCKKFGFPYSPHATFMRKSILEWVKYQLKPLLVIEGGEVFDEGVLSINYSKPEGKILPCVNEYPKIIAKYKGNNNIKEPQEFKDSRNIYKIWYIKDNIKIIDINILTYFYLYNATKTSPPTLPLWMNPIQLRIIPVKNEFLDYVKEIIRELEGIRFDIDDINDSLGNKIRRAGMEWIPYVAVIGEKEIKTNTLAVRIRAKNEQRNMTIGELRNEILGNDPLRIKNEFPIFLSQRPKLNYL